MSRPREVGLVLTGGGARAAYQVGVLTALAEILGTATPFRVLTGVSAGAINATALAVHGDDFVKAASELWQTWSSLTPEQVYRTDVRSLGAIAGQWLSELGGGGLHAGNANHLLDTTPLRDFLAERIPVQGLRRHLDSGTLRAVGVTATSYGTGTAITFYDCENAPSPAITPWARSMRMGERATLMLDHVLASAAIPMFFAPVPVDRDMFGDGCIRLSTPLSPAIHLGADALVAIGVRCPTSGERTVASNYRRHTSQPSLSEIGGVLLDAVFLDALDSDVERLERINRTLSLVSPAEQGLTPLRHMPLLALQPSRDLAELATRTQEHLPRTLRYLLRGIGVSDGRGGDLLSYLAFTPEYLEQLLELGRDDTLARRGEVERFFAACEAERATLERALHA